MNGKRNGKGKEYYKGKLSFEGEYLYNKRREGKEYINGILEYEGEYLCNKKWNGKGYEKHGNIIYSLNNGNGNVKEYLYYHLKENISKDKGMMKGKNIFVGN